jgi:hypothetical protein
MGIFASYVTRIVPLPMDDPHTVTIQKLSGKALAAARQARIAASLDLIRSLGDAAGAFRSELTAGGDGAAAITADGDDDGRPDLSRKYDRSTVLVKGVTAWTYTEPLTPDRLDDLDDQAADYLFRAILELTLPPGAVEKKTAT